MSGFVLSRTAVHRARTGEVRKAPLRPGAWLDWLAQALRTIETRRHLAEMDARMLKDIGITRSDALEEAQRAPWDVGPKGV